MNYRYVKYSVIKSAGVVRLKNRIRTHYPLFVCKVTKNIFNVVVLLIFKAVYTIKSGNTEKIVKNILAFSGFLRVYLHKLKRRM